MARPEKKLKKNKEINGAIKRGRGRPAIQFDLKEAEEISKMASIGATQEMIAYVKDMSADSIAKYYGGFFDKGKNKGKMKLMNTATNLALGGNVPLLIFLLKTQCGLSERQIIEHEGTFELPTPIFSTAKPKK